MSTNDVIQKIQHLLALAENEAASDNEATLAYRQAQKLMHKHAIEQWQLNHDHNTNDIIEQTVHLTVNPANRDKTLLAAIVARANQCGSYRISTHRKNRWVISDVVFVGVEEDIEKSIMLWQSMELYRASHWRKAFRTYKEREIARIRNSNLHPWRKEMLLDKAENMSPTEFRNGFYAGFADGIRERFMELEQELETTSIGTELVTTKQTLVQRHLAEKTFSPDRSRERNRNLCGIRAGREASRHVGVGLNEMHDHAPRVGIGR